MSLLIIRMIIKDSLELVDLDMFIMSMFGIEGLFICICWMHETFYTIVGTVV